MRLDISRQRYGPKANSYLVVFIDILTNCPFDK
jgi:hypothetical protein